MNKEIQSVYTEESNVTLDVHGGREPDDNQVIT